MTHPADALEMPPGAAWTSGLTGETFTADQLRAERRKAWDAAMAEKGAAVVSEFSDASPRKYLTIVYRLTPDDDAAALVSHPRMSAASWSHALDDRNAARAALAALAGAQKQE